jgi:lipid A 3-O-deacylase
MKRFTTAFFILIFATSIFADSISLYVQNDVLHPEKSDKHYTHGTRIDYMEKKSQSNFTGFAVGQYLYTPANISDPAIQDGDRPYAGWFYGAFIKENYNGKFLDHYEIQLGFVGDYSYAEEAQIVIHEWTDSRTPMGWDNQIANEFGANFHYQKKYITKIKDWFDFIPQAGYSVGNVYAGANLGGTFRAGYRLPENFNLKSIEPSIMSQNKRILDYGYGFFKLNNRFVAHNITLDGSLFDNDSVYTVDSRPYVLDIEYGWVAKIYSTEIIFSLTQRTDEYYNQEGSDKFGSIILSWYF